MRGGGRQKAGGLFERRGSTFRRKNSGDPLGNFAVGGRLRNHGQKSHVFGTKTAAGYSKQQDSERYLVFKSASATTLSPPLPPGPWPGYRMRPANGRPLYRAPRRRRAAPLAPLGPSHGLPGLSGANKKTKTIGFFLWAAGRGFDPLVIRRERLE